MADDTNKALDDLLAAIATRRQTGSMRPAEKSTFGDVVADGISNGLLMGYGDEAKAWVGANIQRRGNYDDLLAQERERLATVRAERPVQTTLAELAGAAAPLLLTGGAAAPVAGAATAARGAGLLEMLGQGAYRGLLGGGVGGAVQGFGEGEGGLGNRLDKAVEGGLMGAAGGAVLGGTVPLASAAVRHLRTPVVDRARDTVQRALDADGLSPEDVARAYQARNGGPNAKPELISDLYPQSNVSTRLEGALNQPGRDRGTIVGTILGRGDDQGDRLLTDFERVFGSNQGQFHSTFQRLDTARRTDATPLYDRAYSHDISDRIGHEVMEDSTRVRTPQDDYMPRDPAERTADDAFARRRAEQDRTGRAQPLDSTGQLSLGDILTRVPSRALTYAREQAKMAGSQLQGRNWSLLGDDMPTVRDLDFVKRGLDRMIEKDTDPLTRRMGSDGYAAQQVKHLLVNWVDDATTVNGQSLYGQARAAWSGPSSMIDAMEYGRAALRERAEVTAERVARMARSEQDAFLVGVLDAAQQKLGSIRVDRDASGSIGMTANSRRAIQAAMSAVTPDPAMQRQLTDRLINSIERETQIARTTRDLTGNSRTALRLAEQQSERRGDSVLRAIAGEALSIPVTGMPGLATGLGAGGRLVRGGLERTAQTAETARQGEVARLLSGQNVGTVTNNMREVAARRDSLEALLRRRSAVDPTIAGFAGGRAVAGQGVQPNYSRLPIGGLLGTDRLR